MSPQVVKAKIEELTTYLSDLEQFENISYEQFLKGDHYAIERLLELLVITSSDAILHVLSVRGEETPTTLRTTFLRAEELGLLPRDLANKLAEAAAMRNLIVHAYGKVDARRVYDSIGEALDVFNQLAKALASMDLQA